MGRKNCARFAPARCIPPSAAEIRARRPFTRGSWWATRLGCNSLALLVASSHPGSGRILEQIEPVLKEAQRWGPVFFCSSGTITRQAKRRALQPKEDSDGGSLVADTIWPACSPRLAIRRRLAIHRAPAQKSATSRALCTGAPDPPDYSRMVIMAYLITSREAPPLKNGLALSVASRLPDLRHGA
jgi:hypothetical protein